MKVKIIRSFEEGQKEYIPGNVYSVSLESARRYVSRGDAEIIVEKEVRKPAELEIRPKRRRRK